MPDFRSAVSIETDTVDKLYKTHTIKNSKSFSQKV